MESSSQAIIDLVVELREKSCTLNFVRGELKFVAPDSMTREVKQAIISALRARKAELIAYFEELEREHARPKTAIAACNSSHCAGCYWVSEAVKLHPPRTCEDFLAWRESWLKT